MDATYRLVDVQLRHCRALARLLGRCERRNCLQNSPRWTQPSYTNRVSPTAIQNTQPKKCTQTHLGRLVELELGEVSDRLD